METLLGETELLEIQLAADPELHDPWKEEIERELPNPVAVDEFVKESRDDTVRCAYQTSTVKEPCDTGRPADRCIPHYSIPQAGAAPGGASLRSAGNFRVRVILPFAAWVQAPDVA